MTEQHEIADLVSDYLQYALDEVRYEFNTGQRVDIYGPMLIAIHNIESAIEQLNIVAALLPTAPPSDPVVMPPKADN